MRVAAGQLSVCGVLGSVCKRRSGAVRFGMTIRRHELTDAQWAQLEPLLAELAPQHPKTGRPNKDHRMVLNGIL